MATYRAVIFYSRNKDNAEITNFKQRSVCFMADIENMESIFRRFDTFVEDGVPGELSRLYIGINDVNMNKVRKEFVKFLIDNEDFNLCKAESKICSIAALAENKLTKRWIFDCDTDLYETLAFVAECEEECKRAGIENKFELFRTVNNFGVISDKGFDTRKILQNHKNVGLQRDGHKCYAWKQKPPIQTPAPRQDYLPWDI